MGSVVVFVVLVALAVTVAVVAERRRNPAPTRTAYAVPRRLDRRDFARPDAPWLIALFSSATCSTCAAAWAAVEPLADDDVVVQELEVTRDAELHERYAIEAVPTLVIADADGFVHASHLGRPTPGEIRTRLDEARQTTST